MRASLGRRLTTALIVGGMFAAAAPAHADVRSDGLWYFEMLNVQAAHDAGWTGDGVTIAVLDTPINPDIPTLRDADLWIDEAPQCFSDGAPVPPITTDVVAGHGTNVASLIVGSGADGGVKGVAPDASVLYYPVVGFREGDRNPCYDSAGEQTDAAIARAIEDAIDRGADIISMSLGYSPGHGVLEAITRALAHDVILVNALPNELAGGLYSSIFNGGVGVQAIDRTGAVQTYTDSLGGQQPLQDANTDVAAPGVGILYQGDDAGDWTQQRLADGTSFATPIVAGFLAVVSERYPEATPNQLLQTLIRNTGVDDHELDYDEDGFFGYGFVSLTHMLRVDPTQYDDVNPLITVDGSPSPSAIEAARGEAPTTEVTPSPPPAGNPVAVVLLPVLIVLGIVVVVAVAIVLVVVMVRRRARA